MSNIWNPYAFGVTGEPMAPQTQALRVYGAEPSKEQLAMAQQTFAKFCMTARLSAVPNPTEQGFLPDGSKYRIVTVGNARIMEVRVEGATEVSYVLEMAHGLLRNHGFVNTGSFDTVATKELKETGTSSYVNTQKLMFREEPDTVLSGIPGPMFGGGTTGLTKKFHQFLRGASAAYTKYFHEVHNLPIGSMYLGNGVAVFALDGKKRAFVYSFNTMGDVRALEMEILPAKQLIDGNIPSEIDTIFGGCPMPPTQDVWYRGSYLVLSSSAIDSAIGHVRTAYLSGYSTDDFLGPRAGTSFSLPPMSVTDNGSSLYFVAGWREEGEPFRPLYSRPVRIDFGVTKAGEKYYLTASAAAIKYQGIADYVPLGAWKYRPGITKGIVAVGMFNGTPTFFEVEREAHTWQSEIDEQTENTKITVNISGGITEECVVYNEDVFTPTNEAGACSASISFSYVGEEDRTAMYYGYRFGAIVQIWSRNWSASVSEKVRVRGGATAIVTGSDGAIQITKAHMDSYISYDVSVSASSQSFIEVVKTDYSYSVPTHYDIYLPPSSTSGTIEVINPGVPEIHQKSTWVMHPTGVELWGAVPGIAYYTYGPEENWKRQVIDGLLPEYTKIPESVSGHVKFGKQNVVVDSTTIYAGNTQYTINAKAILEEYETEDHLTQIKESRASLQVDPLYLVRPHYAKYDDVSPEMWYAFSGLGQANVIAHYNAWNWNTSQEQDRELNYGPLGAGDRDYPNIRAHFVGKT